jgi:hypothetical protein
VSKISEKGHSPLDNYFSQGLTGITTRRKEADYFTALEKDAFLSNLHLERRKSTVASLLKNAVLDSYVQDALQALFVQNETLSTTEYNAVVSTLAQSLKKAAQQHATESREYKVLLTASKLALQLETGRLQYKTGRDAYLSA